MKKGFLFFFLLFIFFLNSYAQEETLTNKSIVDLSELGFSDDLIITKIKTSKTDFVQFNRMNDMHIIKPTLKPL